MDINKMRNIVILKDLPSNLIEEAFVVLKENQKIKKFEFAESKSDKFSVNSENENDNENEFVVKEAELLVSNYINELENKSFNSQKPRDVLLKKYKYSKISSIVLGCSLFITCMYILFIN